MAIRTSSYDFEEAEDSQNSEGMGNLDAGKSQFIGDDEESGDFEVDHINSRADCKGFFH